MSRAEMSGNWRLEARQPPFPAFRYSRRLAAGGSWKSSITALRFLRRDKDQDQCHCKDTNTVVSPKTKQKAASKRRLKCQHPVVVVPSRDRVDCEEDSDCPTYLCLPRCPMCPLRKKKVKKANEKDKMKSTTIVKSDAVKQLKFESCNCNETSSELPLQMQALTKKLETQANSEMQQNQQLHGINEDLRQLHGKVDKLSERCQLLEQQQQQLLTSQKDNKAAQELIDMFLCCRHLKLPILSSMQQELCQIIGQRNSTKIALTVQQRPDKIYHVNVGDLQTEQSLGCLLVNEAGIKEANSLGVFQQILTFYIIEGGNPSDNRIDLLGSIHFETVR